MSEGEKEERRRSVWDTRSGWGGSRFKTEVQLVRKKSALLSEASGKRFLGEGLLDSAVAVATPDASDPQERLEN